MCARYQNGTDGQQRPTGPCTGTAGAYWRARNEGDPGKPGPAGSDGTDGVDGAPGRNGTDGLPGQPGTLSDAVIKQLERNILRDVWKPLSCKGITESSPATSCKEVYECYPTALPHGSTLPMGIHQVPCSCSVLNVLICAHLKFVLSVHLACMLTL